jgi:hypothetical protein
MHLAERAGLGLVLFLSHPFDIKRLEFFRGVNAFLNQQGVHSINRRHEALLSTCNVQSFFKAHRYLRVVPTGQGDTTTKMTIRRSTVNMAWRLWIRRISSARPSLRVA